jgi:hypothetical protein
VTPTTRRQLLAGKVQLHQHLAAGGEPGHQEQVSVRRADACLTAFHHNHPRTRALPPTHLTPALRVCVCPYHCVCRYLSEFWIGMGKDFRNKHRNCWYIELNECIPWRCAHEHRRSFCMCVDRVEGESQSGVHVNILCMYYTFTRYAN